MKSNKSTPLTIEEFQKEARKLGYQKIKPLPRRPNPKEKANLEYFRESFVFSLFMALFGIVYDLDISRWMHKLGRFPLFSDWP